MARGYHIGWLGPEEKGNLSIFGKKIEKGEVSLSASEVRGFLVCWVMMLMQGHVIGFES